MLVYQRVTLGPDLHTSFSPIGLYIYDWPCLGVSWRQQKDEIPDWLSNMAMEAMAH